MDERHFYENVAPKQVRPIQSLKRQDTPQNQLKYDGGDRRVQSINRDPIATGMRAGVPLRQSSGLLAKKVGMR
jgi:hypothetical protein